MELSLVEYGFKKVEEAEVMLPGCSCLLKKQTLYMNRAVCVVELSQLPENFSSFIFQLRRKVAFKIRFIPIFYVVGIQVIIVCPNIASAVIDPSKYVAKFDNQWAIIQSLFLVDPMSKTFVQARSWGQFVTGEYQESISRQLSLNYMLVGI
ncbi:hypothetical protein L1286_14920 [Pseudoalteromonas sp. SMS1]|uniref:hypothetical protein n=1 Tax=Pseudoalteromonas sp. SMS1 TaxID=2908894 RepID=UPI001F2A2ECE|nr:hypothetical protein [Pseudoalteromonas sp. SMS1]MCF2858776.1 hypothetical protein [Pseudoalteromonas sp. SMS1]